jgi:hypothetical protein
VTFAGRLPLARGASLTGVSRFCPDRSHSSKVAERTWVIQIRRTDGRTSSSVGFSLGYWTLRWAERSPTQPNAAQPPERRNPALERDFGEAAEGIRTLDLLHGKQKVEPSHGEVSTSQRPGRAPWKRHHTSGLSIITLSPHLTPHLPANPRTRWAFWLCCAALRGGAEPDNQSGRRDLNLRPAGPQPVDATARCVRGRPLRRPRPLGGILRTHRTMHPVPRAVPLREFQPDSSLVGGLDQSPIDIGDFRAPRRRRHGSVQLRSKSRGQQAGARLRGRRGADDHAGAPSARSSSARSVATLSMH